MKITVRISESTAIASGLANAGNHVIDVTPADLATLTDAERSRLASSVYNSIYSERYSSTPDAVPSADFAGLAADLRARLAAAAKKQAAEETAAAKQKEEKAAHEAVKSDEEAAFFADPEARWNSNHPRTYQLHYYSPAAQAEAERRDSLDAAAKRAAEEAKDQAKRDFIAAWVGANGTDSERARLAAGMLCRDEIVARIADASLDPIAGDPGEWPDCCDSRDCPCTPLKEISCLSEEAFVEYQRLTALPGVTVDSFSTGRACLKTENESFDFDEETAGPVETHAELHLRVGPFMFDRSIRLN